VFASTFAGVAFSTDNGNDWSTIVGTDQANQVTNCVAAIDSSVFSRLGGRRNQVYRCWKIVG